jgi:hypothetical protein
MGRPKNISYIDLDQHRRLRLEVVISEPLTEKELGYIERAVKNIPSGVQDTLINGRGDEEGLRFIVTAKEDWMKYSRSGLVRLTNAFIKKPGYWGKVRAHYDEHSNELCIDIKEFKELKRMENPPKPTVKKINDDLTLISQEIVMPGAAESARSGLERAIMHELGHAIDDVYVHKKCGSLECGSMSASHPDKFMLDLLKWDGAKDALKNMSGLLGVLEDHYGLPRKDELPKEYDYYPQELMAASIAFLIDPRAGEFIKADGIKGIPDIFTVAQDKPFYRVLASYEESSTLFTRLAYFLTNGLIY